MKRAAALTAALVLMLGAPAGALAKACPQTSAADLEDEVMCPVCGTTLGIAREAPQARRERAFIERLVARCQTKNQIRSALVAEFGDRVLAEPPKDGFGLSAYLVPALAVALALCGVALAAARWRRSRPGGGTAGTADSLTLEAGSHARVDAELARLDAGRPRADL